MPVVSGTGAENIQWQLIKEEGDWAHCKQHVANTAPCSGNTHTHTVTDSIMCPSLFPICSCTLVEHATAAKRLTKLL